MSPLFLGRTFVDLWCWRGVCLIGALQYKAGLTKEPVAGVDADLPYIVTPEQIFEGKKAIGKKVMILNADPYYMAPSLAEKLAKDGHEVTIASGVSVGGYMEFTLEHPNLHRMMHEQKIEIIGDVWASEVQEGRIELYSLYGEGSVREYRGPGNLPRNENTTHKWHDFDTLVLVTGRSSNVALYNEFPGAGRLMPIRPCNS